MSFTFKNKSNLIRNLLFVCFLISMVIFLLIIPLYYTFMGYILTAFSLTALVSLILLLFLIMLNRKVKHILLMFTTIFFMYAIFIDMVDIFNLSVINNVYLIELSSIIKIYISLIALISLIIYFYKNRHTYMNAKYAHKVK